MNKIELTVGSFVKKLAGREVGSNEELLESGILDSFSFVELVELAENELNINIDFSDIEREKFKTISDITNTLKKMQ